MPIDFSIVIPEGNKPPRNTRSRCEENITAYFKETRCSVNRILLAYVGD
jgi:hypothetical protein